MEGINNLNLEMTSDYYTHKVYGKVMDEDGNQLSGVTVSLLNPDKSVSNLTTSTDATGYYQLPSVPQGSRIISFTKDDYISLEAEIFLTTNDYQYNAVIEKIIYEFTDYRDGKTYKTVKIGDQVWMAENLAYDAGGGCWAYDDDESNVDTYGRLYTWEVAQEACPSGWHLPTDDEWKELEMTIGMSQSEADYSGWRGTHAGTKLKAISGWKNNGNGQDVFGFSGLPGGGRRIDGNFVSIGDRGLWWSATEYKESHAFYRGLDYDYTTVFREIVKKGSGISVRCVRD